MLHQCYTSVTPVLHQCYTSVTPVLHQCYTSVTPVLHQCYTSVTPVLHQCYTSVTPVLHQCYTSVTPVLHQCYTSVTPVLHQCYTSVTPVIHVSHRVLCIIVCFRAATTPRVSTTATTPVSGPVTTKPTSILPRPTQNNVNHSILFHVIPEFCPVFIPCATRTAMLGVSSSSVLSHGPAVSPRSHSI